MGAAAKKWTPPKRLILARVCPPGLSDGYSTMRYFTSVRAARTWLRGYPASFTREHANYDLAGAAPAKRKGRGE